MLRTSNWIPQRFLHDHDYINKKYPRVNIFLKFPFICGLFLARWLPLSKMRMWPVACTEGIVLSRTRDWTASRNFQLLRRPQRTDSLSHLWARRDCLVAVQLFSPLSSCNTTCRQESNAPSAFFDVMLRFAFFYAKWQAVEKDVI